jgi:sigma-B regulation protein RsbU (phosphoserine phosphatase)
MLPEPRLWREQLAIVDRIMKSVSDISDPNEMVRVYWEGVHELLPFEHYLALSRRGIDPPEFLVTRSSRFSEDVNPWTERGKLPRLSGGLLGEIAYADRPLIIEDVPARLHADDPGRFFLGGFQSLVALPQYEGGRGLNVGITLFPPDVPVDRSLVPMMHWQAGLFGRGTQSLVLRNQLEAALRDLDRELQSVGEIQRSLLPQRLPELPGFDLAAHYQTSARAGGDYYDFFPLGDDDWGIFIADVSGHGTPAAVLMAITHAIAHTRPGSPKPPRELIGYLNHHLARGYTSSGAFVTAFYAALSPRRRRLTYATAGHNPPRLLRAGEVLSLEDGGGLPLGVLGEEEYAEATLTLAPGDLLLLYTDGITEAMGPPAPDGRREIFGLERLDEVLRGCATSNAADCIRGVRAALASFTGGAAPRDDETLVALCCTG